MPFIITIKYEEKLKSGMFYVPEHLFREVKADDLVELLSKLMIEIVQMQKEIHQEELEAKMVERNDQDIPF